MSKRRHRGFTLLELAVALAMSGIVIGTITGLLVTILNEQRRSRAHSELLRYGTFSSQLMNHELRQAGLGVPRSFDQNCVPVGANLRQTCVTATVTVCGADYGTVQSTMAGALRFDTSVILAATDQVGVVADLPRPDAQYNAFGPLHNRATAVSGSSSDTSSYLMWHNENNGLCAPGNTCSVASTSIFFNDAAQTCGTGSSANNRQCPWGMRRVLGGERLQVVAGDATWSTAAADGSGTSQTVTNIDSGRLALKLSVAFDLPKSDADFPTRGKWGNQLPGEGPGGVRGVGWVTTLDRVFFVHDPTSRTLLRVQCSGDPDPGHTDWPNHTVARLAVPLNIGNLALTPAGAPVAANSCIGPEVVAREIDAVEFSYFNAAGNAITPGADITGANAPTCGASFAAPATSKSAVRRIDYVLRFRKSVDGNAAHDVRHQVNGSIRLQNLL